MVTPPTGGEISGGVVDTEVIYEGDATRADVLTHEGHIEKGVTYAAQIAEDRIKEGNAYVKEYTTWDNAVQKVADAENGDVIVGRVIVIDKNRPEIATDGGTWTAARASARRASVERFQTGQVILIRADGSGTAVAVGNTLSLKAASDFLWVQDLVNGALYALEATADADAWIRARVI